MTRVRPYTQGVAAQRKPSSELPDAKKHPTREDRDEKVSIPLDPEVALRALLQVDPEAEPAVSDAER